jgi:MFS transporter, DHA3 family, macrolide efflux protein
MKAYLKNRLTLFTQTAYARYFIAVFIATLANGFVYISNTWLVVSLNHSLTAVLWSFLAYWIPKVIFSPVAGTLIDRIDRKLLVGFGIMSMGLCFGSFGIILSFFPHLHLYWIYIIYFVLGTLGAFFMPGIMAFFREIIAKKDLLYANANLDFGYQIANICGIGFAGYMIHLFGFTGSYLLASGLFLVSSLCIFNIADKYRIHAKTDSTHPRMLSDIPADFKKSINYLCSNKPLLVLYITQLFIILIIMTAPALLAPFAKTILHANAIEFGHIEIMMTVGMIFGGILLIYLAQKIGFNIILLLSTLLLVLSLLGFSMVNTVLWGQVAYFLVGFGLGSWSILISRAQALTDPNYQGRVQSVFSALTGLGIVILYLGINMASDLITIRHIYWIVGVLAIVPIVLVLIYPQYFEDNSATRNRITTL